MKHTAGPQWAEWFAAHCFVNVSEKGGYGGTVVHTIIVIRVRPPWVTTSKGPIYLRPAVPVPPILPTSPGHSTILLDIFHWT